MELECLFLCFEIITLDPPSLDYKFPIKGQRYNWYSPSMVVAHWLVWCWGLDLNLTMQKTWFGTSYFISIILLLNSSLNIPLYLNYYLYHSVNISTIYLSSMYLSSIHTYHFYYSSLLLIYHSSIIYNWLINFLSYIYEFIIYYLSIYP